MSHLKLDLGRSRAGPIVRLGAKGFLVDDPRFRGLSGFSRLVNRPAIELYDLLLVATKGPQLGSLPRLLPWIDPARTPILGAGVTFASSLRERRLEVIREGRRESVQDDGRPSPYDVVYDPANPPEIFHKAYLRGHLAKADEIWIRPDSDPAGGIGSSVPEPERVLLVNSNGEIVAETIGSDTTARQIESRSSLYLPAAKTYPGCATLCEWLTVFPPGTKREPVEIGMRIARHGRAEYEGSYTSDQMKRSAESLVLRARTLAATPSGSFQAGFLLFTGTGIVPPNEFSLEAGDHVSIHSPQLGRLDAVTRVVRYTL